MKAIFVILCLQFSIQSMASSVERFELKDTVTVEFQRQGVVLDEVDTRTLKMTIPWHKVEVQELHVESIKEKPDPVCELSREKFWGTIYNDSVGEQEKMIKLATLEGINFDEASAIYKGWHFLNPPNSWEEFKEYLKSVEEKSRTNVYTDVVEKNEAYNKMLTGFSDSCSQKFVKGYDVKNVPQFTEKVVNEEFIINLDISRALLFEGEAETFAFSYDGEVLNYSINSEFNNYVLKAKYATGHNHYFEFIGERVKKRPSALETEVTLLVENNEAILILNRPDSEYDSFLGEDIELFYEVSTRKKVFKDYGWPLGAVRLEGSFKVPAHDNPLAINTGYFIEADDVELSAEISLLYKNSPRYIEDKSPKQKTNSVEIDF